MLIKVVQYAFVVIDVLVGLLLLVVSMNAITGVHMGITPRGVVIGVIALSFAAGTFAAAYGVAKDLAWQGKLRTALYLLLFLVLAFLFAAEKWRSSSYGGGYAKYSLFCVANLILYNLWLHHKHHLQG